MIRERQFILDVLCCFIKNLPETLSAPDGLEWSWISDIVSGSNLGPLFKEALSEQKLPKPIHAQWLKEQQITFVRNSRALSAAVNLLGILDRAAIPTALIRGLSLAHTIYPEPALRPMCDVDLLIKPNDRQSVTTALEREGFCAVNQGRNQLIYHIDGTVFEIHCSLLNPKRYQKSLNNEVFLESREILDLPEGRIYRLSREHELLCLVTHAFVHHGLERFLPFVDLALLIKKYHLDWDSIVSCCRQARLSKMHLFTLSFVNKLFSLDLETELELFGQYLPPHSARIYKAYIQRLFNADDITHYLRRKRNLFFVAESPYAKFKQAMRFIASDEMLGFINALHNKRTPEEKKRDSSF